MGSRAQVAAAACLVASGLLAGGLGTANADPGQPASDGMSGRPADDASAPVRQPDAATSETGRDLDDAIGDDDTHGRGEAVLPADTAAAVGDEDPVEDPTADDGSDAPPAGGLDVPARAVDGKVDGKAVEEAVEAKQPLPPCCETGEKDCWPWPWPQPDPDDPPGSDNGGGFPGDPPVALPLPLPSVGVPPEFVPPIAEPISPEVVDTVPGVAVAGSGLTGAPVSVPILVTAPSGPGVGPTVGRPTGGAGPGLPAAPRQNPAAPARQPLPATAGAKVAMPASYRVGYGEYLRAAGTSQIAALAVPGLAGILLLTAAGGFVGYRQAKAGHTVSTSGIARYMN